MNRKVFGMKKSVESVLRDTFTRRELQILEKSDEFQAAKAQASPEDDFQKVIEVAFKVLSKQGSR